MAIIEIKPEHLTNSKSKEECLYTYQKVKEYGYLVKGNMLRKLPDEPVGFNADFAEIMNEFFGKDKWICNKTFHSNREKSVFVYEALPYVKEVTKDDNVLLLETESNNKELCETLYKLTENQKNKNKYILFSNQEIDNPESTLSVNIDSCLTFLGVYELDIKASAENQCIAWRLVNEKYEIEEQ